MSIDSQSTRRPKYIGCTAYYAGVNIINMNQITPQDIPFDTFANQSGGFSINLNRIKVPLDGLYEFDYDIQGISLNNNVSVAMRIIKISGAVLTTYPYLIGNFSSRNGGHSSVSKGGLKIDALKNDEFYMDTYRTQNAGTVNSIPGNYSLNIKLISW